MGCVGWRVSTGQWAHARWYSHSCLQDLGPLGHPSPRGGHGSRGGPGWRAERVCVLAGATSRPLGISPASGYHGPALTLGPLSPGLPGRPASPCGERGGELGPVGRGVVVLGSSLTGVPSSPFSPRSPCGRGQGTPASGRKAQVTSVLLLPTSPPPSLGPQCPTAPDPTTRLVPHYLLATQPSLPRGARSARLALLPRLPRVTLSRGEGATGQHGGARGLLGGEGAQHSTLHSLQQHGLPGQPLQSPTDGWMDRQVDRGAMPLAVTLPLGHSCL